MTNCINVFCFLKLSLEMGKVLNISELEKLLMDLKAKNIVFTNGCFDILHPGHIHILEVSKSIL